MSCRWELMSLLQVKRRPPDPAKGSICTLLLWMSVRVVSFVSVTSSDIKCQEMSRVKSLDKYWNNFVSDQVVYMMVCISVSVAFVLVMLWSSATRHCWVCCRQRCTTRPWGRLTLHFALVNAKSLEWFWMANCLVDCLLSLLIRWHPCWEG